MLRCQSCFTFRFQVLRPLPRIRLTPHITVAILRIRRKKAGYSLKNNKSVRASIRLRQFLLKINFATWETKRTGGIRVLFEVANRLVARGHEVSFTSLGRRDAHLWFPLQASVNYVERTAPIVHRSYPHLLEIAFRELTPWRLDRIRKLSLATPECDINVATFCLTAFAVHRSGKGVPFYYVQHYEPLFFKDTYMKTMAEETYQLPMRVIAVSSWLRNLLKEKYSKDAQVILNGVDRKVFFPRAIAREGKSKRILCVSHRQEWKGLKDLMEAMKTVHKEYPATELAVVTQDKVSKLGIDGNAGFPMKILRAPTDEDLAKEYSSSDVFVSPSWYEGFGLVVLEAMSCGVPVITTPHGTEDYAINESNALVVSPKNPAELAKAIKRIFTDEALSSRITAGGLQTAEKLTWERTATSFEDAVNSALK
jgi:glycosyltransferase involved in cell wall biosynthesis